MSDYIPPFKEGDTVEDLEVLSVGLLAGGVTATRCRGKVNGRTIEFVLPGTYTISPEAELDGDEAFPEEAENPFWHRGEQP